MKRFGNKWLILLDPDPDNKGGGGNNDPLRLAQNEAIEWRKKYDAIKTDHDTLTKNYNSLEGKYSTLEKTHTETQEKLGNYTATEARQGKLKELLGHKDYKGKVEVDESKAMKWLARGAFNEANLEAEVREAIEFAGEPVKPASSSLPPGGAGDDKGGDRSKKSSSDPLGDFIRSGGVQL